MSNLRNIICYVTLGQEMDFVRLYLLEKENNKVNILVICILFLMNFNLELILVLL